MPQISSRSWGTRFDTLPTSPPISPPADDIIQPATPDPLHKREDKMPHDASVFVGSLPSNIDQQELTRLLSEHLSEHTEVKNIKVVRDSKGGICAFVQCENATSATTLIHTLHSNPQKSFLGRYLRYEPARAFRTLLISYRTPTQHLPPDSGNGQSARVHSDRIIELNLPSAMRVWKPKNSKFFSLLYNAEAVNAENDARYNQVATVADPSLFLQPVVFDAETLRNLAGYFGPLEHFTPYQFPYKVHDNEGATEVWKRYPAPHDAPRSPRMDTTCWEIKWEHRDDCMSALTTLRRVPHLTATWAHQPPPSGFGQRSICQGGQTQHNVTPYPLHVQDRLQLIRSRAGSLTASLDFPQSNETNPRHSSEDIAGGSSEFPVGHTEINNDTTAAEERSSAMQKSNLTNRQLSSAATEWSDTDFPPLTNSKWQQHRKEHGVWTDKGPPIGEIARSQSLPPPDQIAESFTTLGESSEDMLLQEQELEIPPTPGLGRSPLTPKTPGSLLPPTPTSNGNSAQGLPFREFEGKNGYYGDFTRSHRELDPTTLFVGGLETFGPGAWDEEKLNKFFSRFEGLESVKIVRPLNSHAAFAFVKFNNTESPARAVLEEHNRVYEGRAMRVQLRDCNPPRGAWRYSRGRGQFHQPSFGPQRRVWDNSNGPQEKSNSLDSHEQSGQLADNNPHLTSSEETDPDLPIYSEKNMSKFADESTDNGNTGEPSVKSRSASPETPASNAPQSEIYREWYDEPLSAALTPPPSSFGSSASAPLSTSALPYTMAGGYYAPPWVQPYPQPMPYQMPYIGYPGYAIPSQHLAQTFPRPPGSGIDIPTASGSWPSVNMYGSYIPYQNQPARTPTTDPTQSQHLNSRAPLAPTGFIQNEQGTLIAVYQPEALDQYMAGTHVVPPASMPQHPMPAMTNWPQYPQPHYPFTAPPMAMPPRPTLPSAPNMTWIPNQGFTSQQSPTPNISQSPSVGFGLRGGYNGTEGQSGRRQMTRRDQNNAYNNQGRNNQSRSFTNRNSRGNLHNAGYHTPGDTQSNVRQSHINQNAGDWNQRNAGR